MFSRRFLISWIASSVVMFFLSYLWHGVFLTDLSRLTYPKGVFLFFAALVYLLIGFVITKAVDHKSLVERFKRKPFIRGLIAGPICGIAFFIISTVVGVSFSTGSRIENLLLDVSWQTIEQLAGGMVVGALHYMIYDPAVIPED